MCEGAAEVSSRKFKIASGIIPMVLLKHISPARVLVGICAVLAIFLLEGAYPLLGFISDETEQALQKMGDDEAEKITKESKGTRIFAPDSERTYSAPITWAASAKLGGYLFIHCAAPEPLPSDDKTPNKDQASKEYKLAGTGEACKVESATFSTSSKTEAFIRWDRFLFVAGLLIFCLMALAYLNRMAPQRKESAAQGFSASASLEQHLLEDTERAFDRGDALFARSSLMLVSGILVAFLGIVAFAFLTSASVESNPGLIDFSRRSDVPLADLERMRQNEFIYSLISSIARNFRYVLIFIFVETVAWFLLKQYRALIEDYKAFYRIYLRRQNYAMSYLMLKDKSLKQSAETLVSASMLQEDLSGVLSKGQEIEGRTQLEFAERNSFSVVANFLERIGQLGQSAAAAMQANGGKDPHSAAEHHPSTPKAHAPPPHPPIASA
jgi:hypothetical protein